MALPAVKPVGAAAVAGSLVAALNGAPGWVTLSVLLVAALYVVLHAVIPQNSGDRTKWWSDGRSRRERRRIIRLLEKQQRAAGTSVVLWQALLASERTAPAESAGSIDQRSDGGGGPAGEPPNREDPPTRQQTAPRQQPPGTTPPLRHRGRPSPERPWGPMPSQRAPQEHDPISGEAVKSVAPERPRRSR